MQHKANLILGIASILILVFALINLYTYRRDTKVIQDLTKEKLKLEIEILKKKNYEIHDRNS